MAKHLEQLRAQGLLASYSADESVGIAVQDLLFKQRLTRTQLGKALGVSQQVASRKVRGEVTWSITDIMRAAQFLGVDPSALLPRYAKTPAQLMLDEGSDLVAGTGFEPVTSGL